MGVRRQLTALDDRVARRWPHAFDPDARTRFIAMIVYQAVALVALVAGVMAQSFLVTNIAILCVASTLIELIRLMPRRDEQ